MKVMLKFSGLNDPVPFHLREFGHGESLLLRASKAGNLELVRALIQYDNSLDHLLHSSGNGQRLTPLIASSREGHCEVVKELLRANPSDQHLCCVDKYGRTPLMHSSCRGHLHVVLELIAANNSEKHILRQSQRGWTALMHACHNGRADIVNALLAEHPVQQLATKNDAGCTAADLARKQDHSEITKLLASRMVSLQRRQVYQGPAS
jgi:ankyrin repeat protein